MHQSKPVQNVQCIQFSVRSESDFAGHKSMSGELRCKYGQITSLIASPSAGDLASLGHPSASRKWRKQRQLLRSRSFHHGTVGVQDNGCFAVGLSDPQPSVPSRPTAASRLVWLGKRPNWLKLCLVLHFNRTRTHGWILIRIPQRMWAWKQPRTLSLSLEKSSADNFRFLDVRWH